MKSLKDDILTLLKDKIYITILILVAVGCYGFKLMHPTIGIDDTPYEYYFSDGLIVVVGRWVLFLLNQFLSIGQYAPFLTDFVAVILLIFAAILWSILFKRIIDVNLPDWYYIVFSCLFISNPIISEVFTYFLHNGIAIGYTFSALSLLFFMDGLKSEKKFSNFIFSALSIWIAIGCYESFAVVFLVMGFFALFMGRICGTKYSPIRSVLTLGIILIIAILLRSLITNILIFSFSLQDLVNEAEQRSLTELFNWLFDAEGRATFNMALKRAFVMYGVFAYHYLPIAIYVFSSIIVVICSIFKSIQRKDFWIFVYMCGIFIASWLLIVIEGKATYYRSCQFLPLFCASGILLLLYFCNKYRSKIIQLIAISFTGILIWNQTADMNNWFYIDYKKYEYTKETLNDVAFELKKNYDVSKPLIFIGSPDTPMGIIGDAYVPIGSETFFKMNYITQKIDPHLLEKFYRRDHIWVAQTPSLSLIGWGVDAFGGNQELIKFLEMHGHHFIGVQNYDIINQAKMDYSSLPVWPKEGSIHETEEYIIVNFGY